MQQNLKKLSDGELLNRTKQLVANEREVMTEVLWHLKEVSDRRLYSARGYSSIFAYAVHELKYSEASAGRRLAAMRLLVQVPEMASAIETGTLNLSSVSAAQNFFRREKTEQNKSYTKEDKEKILESLKHKSKREVESILIGLSPCSAVGSEKIKPVTETQTELKIRVDNETLKNLEKLRDLLAHQNPDGSLGNLLGIITDLALDKVDPERIEVRAQKRKAQAEKVTEKAIQKTITTAEEAPKNITLPQSSKLPKTPLAEEKEKNPRFFSASVRRQIKIQNKGRCTYQDPETGRICGSTYQIEIEHRVPIALGGTSEPSQLTVFCKSHNLWAGIQKLGKSVMAPHLRVS